jgi:hypothetical protein
MDCEQQEGPQVDVKEKKWIARPAKENIKKLEMDILALPTGHNWSFARFTQDMLEFDQHPRRFISRLHQSGLFFIVSRVISRV